jgi:hypothetical protein
MMIGMLIEAMVCVLLAATIAHCVVLDRRLRRLKADEDAMRKTIGELIGATDKAERAVSGLRGIVDDCDQTIAAQLREAERHSADLAVQIRSGDDVIARISRIVASAHGGTAVSASDEPAPAAPRNLGATLAAAQAFAERAHRRVHGQAA